MSLEGQEKSKGKLLRKTTWLYSMQTQWTVHEIRNNLCFTIVLLVTGFLHKKMTSHTTLELMGVVCIQSLSGSAPDVNRVIESPAQLKQKKLLAMCTHTYFSVIPTQPSNVPTHCHCVEPLAQPYTPVMF